MTHLSDRISLKNRKSYSLFASADSSFFHGFSGLSASKKFIVLGLALILWALFSFWGSSVLSDLAPSYNRSEASTASEHEVVPAQLNATPAPPKDSATNVSSESSSNPASNHTSVNINGHAISVDTNSKKPEASVNKHIKTSGGSANVSIHSSVNSSGNHEADSFQDVQVDSNTSGNSSTQVQVNQNSKGGD